MQMQGQLSFTDMFTPPKKEIKPIYPVGGTVYIVELDTVKSAKVEYGHICSGYDGGDDYYGYSLLYPNGLHDHTWDHEMGERVFGDKSVADFKAKQKRYIKIKVSDLDMYDLQYAESVRACDGYKQTAFIAKVGECGIAWKDCCTYTFYDIFDSEKEMLQAYKKEIRQIEFNTSKLLPSDKFVDDVLYKVNDKQYASIGYAKRYMQNGA